MPVHQLAKCYHGGEDGRREHSPRSERLPCGLSHCKQLRNGIRRARPDVDDRVVSFEASLHQAAYHADRLLNPLAERESQGLGHGYGGRGKALDPRSEILEVLLVKLRLGRDQLSDPFVDSREPSAFGGALRKRLEA
ncbi:hypothetical protein D3C86_1468510 [compost metagenome]